MAQIKQARKLSAHRISLDDGACKLALQLDFVRQLRSRELKNEHETKKTKK